MALFGAVVGLRLGWAWVKARWSKRHQKPNCVHEDPSKHGGAS